MTSRRRAAGDVHSEEKPRLAFTGVVLTGGSGVDLD